MTGYNDSFIIDGKKKDELIAEDPKSAEIIRPILRGRNIKRYGCNFDNQYLIATFPSLQIDIEQYPAIKSYLLSFGKELLIENGYNWVAEGYLSEWCFKRLEQTGNEIFINDKKISFANNTHARKKTNNKWFETQDAISYWDDFSKQKIVWGEISDKTKFSIDLEGQYMNEATTFLMVGESLLYLLAYLNSNLSEYYFSKIGTTTGVGTIRWKKFTIEQLLVPQIRKIRKIEYEKIVLKILENSAINKDIHEEIDLINEMIYQDFNFTEEEIRVIKTQ